MSTKYTPGPWLFRGRSDSVHRAPTYPYQFGEAIFRFDEEKGPGEADLNLILAAPDLLEALIAMEREKSDYMRQNHLGDPSKETTNKKARAAIAKATGEPQ